MPEVIFPGPEGRLEGRYHPQKDRDAPIAIVLHPCLLYTSPSPRDPKTSRMPSSA